MGMTMGNGWMRNLGVTALAALAGAAILISCRRDFDSPYMPGSPGYAGDDWTRDEDGNGVADSLDKYSPSCKQSPKACLENAKVISRISGQPNSLSARDMILWIGDSAQSPNLLWTPAEGSVRGYELSSSDTAKVKIRDGKLWAASKGSAQISVSVPGADSLSAYFIATVVSGGIRVESVSARDLTLRVGRDTTADVVWNPADADFREYSLVSDQPLVARIVDRNIRGVFPGKANITLITRDGSHKTAFSVIVKDGPELVYTSSLAAEPMFLIKGGPAETPVLQWTPANVTDKIYKLVPVEEGVVTVTDDGQQVKAIKAGNAQVLVKALDGSGKATEISVIVADEAVPVAGIQAADMNLVQGSDLVAPLLTWLPAEATNRKYTLTSSDPGVAIVSTGKVMPVAMGTSEFTVTTDEGGFKDTFTVTVGRPDSSVHVESVAVASFSMPLGDIRKPQAAILPANAGNQAFSLSSDDTTVVNPSGEYLAARKVGTANVRLTTDDGGRTADFKVTVYPTEIPVTFIGADSMSITVGLEASPVVSWIPVDATNLSFTLTSQDTNIAAIRGGTSVLAKSVGLTRINIKSAYDASGVFQVIVNASAVKLTGLIASNFTMNVGDAPRDAIVGYTPANASNKAVTLKPPSGSAVISVNAQNKVIALAPGKAPLTVVSNENPGITAICSVTVVARVKAVTARDDTLRVGQGDKDVSGLLNWDPPNATDKSFGLLSGDSTIVKVTGAQTYRPMKGGKTTVVVKALDGSGKSDTFNVWVKIPVTAIIAKNLAMKTTDPVYNSDPLITFQPADASERNWYLTYLNANASPAPSTIVQIQNGWQLKGVGPGVAALVAIANDNNAIRDTFTVTVTQPVTSITAAGITMKVGDPDRDPSLTVLPDNANDKTVALASGNTAVATVVGGKIHAVGGGTATFTATSNSDPSKTAQFTVTVSIPVISVTTGDLAMKVGDPDREPGIGWNPANATNKNFSLTTSNSGVVSVNGRLMHAVAAGAANIVVIPSDGGKSDTLLVTVSQPVIGITVAEITLKRPEGDKDPVITWNPSSATLKGYTLSGGAAGVATVVANRIHPVGAGTTSMTVTTTDGGKTATFTVTVQVPVEGIHGDNMSMRTNDPDEAPVITFTPADAGNKAYTLVSGDIDVATIVNGKVHAVNRGITTITVTSAENDKVVDTFTLSITR
jgi:uncharacterized protein YjdB